VNADCSTKDCMMSEFRNILFTVKVANMMKVLTASAVQDPTKVEARVKAEAAARIRKHEQTNDERALTEDEKREKLEQKKAKEEGKGIFGCAFK